MVTMRPPPLLNPRRIVLSAAVIVCFKLLCQESIAQYFVHFRLRLNTLPKYLVKMLIEYPVLSQPCYSTHTRKFGNIFLCSIQEKETH